MEEKYAPTYFLRHIDAFKKRSRWMSYRINIVLELITPKVNDIILDLGCGIGTFTIEFSKSSRIIGVDLSTAALRLARELIKVYGKPEQADFICADVQHLPFKRSSSNKLICADLVEHLYPYQFLKLINEGRDVLKKNGIIAIYTPNASHVLEIFRKHNFILKRDPTHVDFKSPSYLLKTLRNAGFSIIKLYFRESHILIFSILEKILMKVPFISQYFKRRICLIARKDNTKMEKEWYSLWNQRWATIDVLEEDILSRTVTGIYSRLREKELLLQWAEVKEGETVLEPGCGSAYHSMDFARRGCLVIGLDFSLKALKIARTLYRRRGLKLELVLGDIRFLPFRSEVFSLVWNQGVLERIPDYPKVLHEMARVARVNGRVIVFVPNKICIDNLLRLLWNLLNKWGLISEYPFGLEHRFTYKSLVKAVEDQRLKTLVVDGIYPLLPPIPFSMKIIRSIFLKMLRGLMLMERYSARLNRLVGRELAIKAIKAQYICMEQA